MTLVQVDEILNFQKYWSCVGRNQLRIKTVHKNVKI